MAKMSMRRKLAIATWSAPQEGNIYGKLTVEATEALRYLEHLRATSGEKVTITHLVGRAVAEALQKAPTLNGRIRLGRFVPHDTIDVTYLVALEGGNNLGKAKIERLDTKSVVDVAVELREMAERLQQGRDAAFEKSKGPIKLLPTWMLRRMLRFVGWLTASLGISFGPLGLERFPFGSCIVTSVGMFGLDEGYVPPTPFARVPLYVLIGAVRDQVGLYEGEIGVRKQVTITATLDHRFVDGFQAAILANTCRDILLNPWTLDGLEGPPEDSPQADADQSEPSAAGAIETGDAPTEASAEAKPASAE